MENTTQNKNYKKSNLDYEEGQTPKQVKQPPCSQTPQQRTENICKIIATFIILVSATFHVYRLFRYGKIFINGLIFK